jgi:hypothetical protein
MSKNRGKSKLSKNVLYNANKQVFHCEKSLATLFYGQPSYIQIIVKKQLAGEKGKEKKKKRQQLGKKNTTAQIRD